MTKSLLKSESDLQIFLSELKKEIRNTDINRWYVESVTHYPCVAIAEMLEDGEGYPDRFVVVALRRWRPFK
ncbi:MAG: hypothetical protein WCS03_18925 [Bacteroidota bacterium]